jgi:hypothetical protein
VASTERPEDALLQRVRRELLTTAEQNGWRASVGIGLADRRAARVGVVVTTDAASAAIVRSWLDEHPQPVEVAVRVVDSIRPK